MVSLSDNNEINPFNQDNSLQSSLDYRLHQQMIIDANRAIMNQIPTEPTRIHSFFIGVPPTNVTQSQPEQYSLPTPPPPPPVQRYVQHFSTGIVQPRDSYAPITPPPTPTPIPETPEQSRNNFNDMNFNQRLAVAHETYRTGIIPTVTEHAYPIARSIERSRIVRPDVEEQRRAALGRHQALLSTSQRRARTWVSRDLPVAAVPTHLRGIPLPAPVASPPPITHYTRRIPPWAILPSSSSSRQQENRDPNSGVVNHVTRPRRRRRRHRVRAYYNGDPLYARRESYWDEYNIIASYASRSASDEGTQSQDISDEEVNSRFRNLNFLNLV